MSLATLRDDWNKDRLGGDELDLRLLILLAADPGIKVQELQRHERERLAVHGREMPWTDEGWANLEDMPHLPDVDLDVLRRGVLRVRHELRIENPAEARRDREHMLDQLSMAAAIANLGGHEALAEWTAEAMEIITQVRGAPTYAEAEATAATGVLMQTSACEDCDVYRMLDSGEKKAWILLGSSAKSGEYSLLLNIAQHLALALQKARERNVLLQANVGSLSAALDAAQEAGGE